MRIIVGMILALWFASSNYAEECDVAIKEVLASWNSPPHEIRSCLLKGRRYVYDKVFAAEKQADFELAWERDGRVILRIDSPKIPEGTTSKRVTVSNEPHRLEREMSEIWYAPDKMRVIQVIVEQNLAQEIPILSAEKFQTKKNRKPQDFWESLRRASLDIGYRMREAASFPIHPGLSRLTRDLEWEVTEAQGSVWEVTAKLNPENPYVSELNVMIDKRSKQIIALKMVDPSRNRETVYRIHHREKNPPFAENDPLFEINEESLKFIGTEP